MTIRLRTKVRRHVVYEELVCVGTLQRTRYTKESEYKKQESRSYEVWRSPETLKNWLDEFEEDNGYVKLGRDDPDLRDALVALKVCTSGPQGPSGTPFGSSKNKGYDEFRKAVERAEKNVNRKSKLVVMMGLTDGTQEWFNPRIGRMK